MGQTNDKPMELADSHQTMKQPLDLVFSHTLNLNLALGFAVGGKLDKIATETPEV